MRFSRTNMRLAAARCRSLSRKIGVQTAEFSITAFCWRNADSRKSRTYERHNAEIRLELFNLSHVGRTPRPIPERAVGKVGFEDGSHLLNQRLLNHPIRNRRDSELSDPAVRLRDTDPLHRGGSVAPVAQLPVQRGQAFLLPVGEGVDGEAVDAGPALVVSDVSPGFGQVGRSVNLVDQ